MRLVWVLFLSFLASCASAEKVSWRERVVDFNEGEVLVDRNRIDLPTDSKGRKIKAFPISEVPYKSLIDGVLLLRYRTSEGSPRERGLLAIDITRSSVVVSNLVVLGESFQWDDNSYARADGEMLRFGLFSLGDAPSIGSAATRRQWVYQKGTVAPDPGPWKGPATPTKYLEPDRSLPCANVANVPECLAEVQRERASATERKDATSPAPVAGSAASAGGRR